MSAKIIPIQIPSELNVPETTVENDIDKTISSIDDSESSLTPTKTKATQSANVTQTKSSIPKHRSNASAKSRSMYNFSTIKSPSAKNENNDQIDNNEPPITSIKSIGSASIERNSTASLSRTIEDKLMGDLVEDIHQNNGNELKLSAHRKRANSIAQPQQHVRNSDDEFDEIEPANNNAGSNLRIRSSIISLFGRMGKARRQSNLSQNSMHEHNTERNDHAPPLRALPQIAATKILRAFSYVGKRILFFCS